jgi:hypothetical protein
MHLGNKLQIKITGLQNRTEFLVRKYNVGDYCIVLVSSLASSYIQVLTTCIYGTVVTIPYVVQL